MYHAAGSNPEHRNLRRFTGIQHTARSPPHPASCYMMSMDLSKGAKKIMKRRSCVHTTCCWPAKSVVTPRARPFIAWSQPAEITGAPRSISFHVCARLCKRERERAERNTCVLYQSCPAPTQKMPLLLPRRRRLIPTDHVWRRAQP